jgi:uncharacterized protein DUF4402
MTKRINESGADMIARCFKGRLFAGIVLFWVVVLILPAQTVNGASATLQANVTINGQPLEVTGSTTLNFGVYLIWDNDGTIVVTTSNTRNASGGVIIFPGSTSFNRAEFNIQGPPNTPYTITLPTGVSFVERKFNGDSVGRELDVTNLTSFSTTVGTETTTGMTDNNGADTIYVGGTLVVTVPNDGIFPLRRSYGEVPLGIQN